MKLSTVINKWRQFIVKMNDKGIPVPMVRDPNTLEGSVSLSLVCVSTLLVVIGIVGKWSGRLGGIDMVNAMQFFYASCTLYFGHSWVHKSEPVTETVIAPTAQAPKPAPVAEQDHSD